MYTQPDLFQLTHPTRGATARSLVTAQFRVHFNSHTPHGVRQITRLNVLICKNISTHTPHTGCDNHRKRLSRQGYPNFNSHTPHGVRHMLLLLHLRLQHFNSHTPHGVRLLNLICCVACVIISTHTPHTGCDQIICSDFRRQHKFQLTHPTRGATQMLEVTVPLLAISTHTPHTGCDLYSSAVICPSSISTHTPHTGCDFGTLSDVQDTDLSLIHI